MTHDKLMPSEVDAILDRQSEQEQVLAALRTAWLQRPELRLGQIVFNVVAEDGPWTRHMDEDIYNCPDTDLLAGLRKLTEEETDG